MGNKEFLSLITKDQVGYLQVAELCPGDAKLDLVTPIPELRSGAVVRCSLVSTHLASAISIAVYQGGKEIHGKLIENLSHMCLTMGRERNVNIYIQCLLAIPPACSPSRLPTLGSIELR